MSNKCIQFRRGTTDEHKLFTGLEGEITVDTDKKTAVVHDGETCSGHPLAREDLNNVKMESIADKGIARSDLDNIETDTIASKGIAKDDLSNVDFNTAGVAKKDLTNIDFEATDAAKKDLTNVTTSTIAGKGIAKNDASNFTTDGKETVAGFGLPDWSRGGTIIFNTITPYTSLKKGVIMMDVQLTNYGYYNLFINNLKIGRWGTDSGSVHYTFRADVDVNDVIKIDSPAGNILINSVIFYPLKGA